MNNTSSNHLHIVATSSLILLIATCILWETIITPVKPGSYFFALKVLPLLFAIKGVSIKNIYTMQWASMLILLYFTEGIVRAMGDADQLSRTLATIEIILSLTFFFASILFVRPFKKKAKAEKKIAATDELSRKQ